MGLFQGASHKWVLVAGFFVLYVLAIYSWTSASTDDRKSVYLFVLPLFGVLFLFGLIYIRYGKEPKIALDIIYERDIPYRYSPAVVSALINQHSYLPSEEVLGACILDLVCRKVLVMRRVDADYEIALTRLEMHYKTDPRLSEADKAVITFLKANLNKGRVMLNSLKDQIANPQSKYFITRWQTETYRELRNLQLIGDNQAYHWFLGLMVSGLIPGIMVALIYRLAGIPLPLLEGFVAACLFGIMIDVVFSGTLPRRSKEGALHYEHWMALRRFLTDFSRIRDVPADAIALWEQYLVYAVPLGVADEVNRHMEALFSSGIKPFSAFGVEFGDYTRLDSFLKELDSFKVQIGSTDNSVSGSS